MFKATLPLLIPLTVYLSTAMVAVIGHQRDLRQHRRARTIETCDPT